MSKKTFPLVSLGRAAQLFATLSLAVGCAADDSTENYDPVATEESEIIGGSEAAVGAWPWQAQIAVLPTFPHYCGGSLLSTEWVLTAAHCVDGLSASDFTVTLGEHDRLVTDGSEQSRGVSTVVKHPSYPGNATSGNADIALLRLASPVLLNSRVGVIRPATTGDGSGQNSIISGWGNDAPGSGATDLLMQATLPIATNASCDAAPDLFRNLYFDELCAGFLDGTSGGCHGDSGGPLSVERFPGYREVVGVVSWGQGTQCGTYTVFGRVSTYASWIRSYVFDSATLPGLDLALT